MKSLLAWGKKYQLFIRMGISALLLLISFWLNGQWEFWVSLSALLLVGLPILFSALSRLWHKQWLDETFLMSIAAIGAFAIGDYAEGVAVVLFYLIGERCEAYSVRRARKMIRSLMDIHPDTARVERNGNVETIPSEDVLVGDILLIFAGERVPTDCVVLSGTASVDTSALTGEAIPLDAEAGTFLSGGMLCLNGHLRAECQKICEESAAARILQLVSEAQDRKSKQETFITAFARIYTPAVVGMAVLLAVFPPLFGADFSFWLHTALVFLVVSCPCALLISVPLSFFGGIGGGASVGILFKGGSAFEVLSKCKVAVFDKTGTVTTGQLRVSQIFSSQGHTAEQVLQTAASLEQFSAHPMAKAIMDKAEGISLSSPTAFEEHPGEGLTAQIEGVTVAVGNHRLMAHLGIKVPALYENTQILVAKGELLGGILLSDTAREGIAQAITDMKALGIRETVMLSGDKEHHVKAVAEAVGIDRYEGELLPEDKYNRLEDLLAKNKGVLYVGDGINDAPSLARADVGIAMGGIGSDAAIEAADIVLANDSPAKLPRAMKIAKRTVSIARANVIFALSVKFAVMVLSVTNAIPGIMWLAVFADVGVSIIAILNAMRCLRVKD